jgi:uncharacterized OsmC-like protein
MEVGGGALCTVSGGSPLARSCGHATLPCSKLNEPFMNADELRGLQAPLKQLYRDQPARARITLAASGTVDDTTLTCRVETGRALVEAGLHPATGGSGLQACSGDMLLQALVACAAVTLRAVATALAVPVRRGTVHAEGDLDFRGTLGVDKDVPVGFQAIRLRFVLDTPASADQLATLLKLTERYCVVLQTLRTPPEVSATIQLDTSIP